MKYNLSDFKKFKQIILGIPLILITNIEPVNALPIPSVSQLSDIQINHWEFQALQSLNNRYDCLDKVPNFSILSRYEFAVELNQCLIYIQQQIKTASLDKETLDTIQRLQQEFSSELISFQRQIGKLETQVSTLENQSFSPYAELEGEVIIALAGAWGGTGNDSNVTLSDRVRLNLEVSFTGKDELQIRLQARNIPEFSETTGTKMANLGFDGDDDNQLEIDELEYQFRLDPRTEMVIYAVGGGLGDLVPTVNPWYSGSGDGSISNLGRENPIRRQGEGAAIGISYDFNKAVNLSLGYASSKPDEPENGLFNSPYAIITQLTVLPNNWLNFSLTYTYSSNGIDTGTGSVLSGEPFGNQADSIIANGFGVEVAFYPSSTINIGGRVALLQAEAQDLLNTPNANIVTWTVMLGFSDLGTEGSLLGFVVGQPPKVVYNSLGQRFEDADTALHFEAFYRWQITDDIAMTPGLIIITNPEHNHNNSTIYVGTIRTTFTF